MEPEMEDPSDTDLHPNAAETAFSHLKEVLCRWFTVYLMLPFLTSLFCAQKFLPLANLPAPQKTVFHLTTALGWGWGGYGRLYVGMKQTNFYLGTESLAPSILPPQQGMLRLRTHPRLNMFPPLETLRWGGGRIRKQGLSSSPLHCGTWRDFWKQSRERR